MAAAMNMRYKGFTLIEFVFVVVLTGILCAIALPRYVNMQSSAHRAGVNAVAQTFREAVRLVNATYRANRFRGERDNIPGFGAGNVDTNAAGYPTDTSNVNSISGSAARCMRVWNGILLNPPSCGTGSTTTADYRATVSGEICTYTYRRDAATTRRFTYNALTGAVVVTNP